MSRTSLSSDTDQKLVTSEDVGDSTVLYIKKSNLSGNPNILQTISASL